MTFRDRVDAGGQLAEALAGRVDPDGVTVLGLPGGSLLCAAEIARLLGAPCAEAPVRRLVVPGSPDTTFAAIDADGGVAVGAGTMVTSGVTDAELAAASEKEVRELGHHQPELPPLEGRTVVLVADGVQTGLLMRAAVRLARRRGAARVLMAAACATEQAVAALTREADEVVVLTTLEPEETPAARYLDFHLVEEEEARALLP